jgi:hypothetical protein
MDLYENLTARIATIRLLFTCNITEGQ